MITNCLKFLYSFGFVGPMAQMRMTMRQPSRQLWSIFGKHILSSLPAYLFIPYLLLFRFPGSPQMLMMMCQPSRQLRSTFGKTDPLWKYISSLHSLYTYFFRNLLCAGSLAPQAQMWMTMCQPSRPLRSSSWASTGSAIKSSRCNALACALRKLCCSLSL